MDDNFQFKFIFHMEIESLNHIDLIIQAEFAPQLQESITN